MRIERVDKLSRCPAAVLLGLEGLLELHHLGWTEESATGLGYDDKAIVAYDELGEAAGIIVYKEQEWKGALSIDLGYVAPDQRQKGVYRALWGELCTIAKEKGFRRVSGTTHRDNWVMREVALTQGRALAWLTYEFRLPEEEKP